MMPHQNCPMCNNGPNVYVMRRNEQVILEQTLEIAGLREQVQVLLSESAGQMLAISLLTAKTLQATELLEACLPSLGENHFRQKLLRAIEILKNKEEE